jgi:hypothetical protein
LGWICLLTPPIVLAIFWGVWGESVLAISHPLSAEVLVVEGWAGRDSMPGAVREFQHGGYRLLVTAGGPTGESWAARNWNYAELAAEELLHCGLPKDRLIVAPAPEADTQRTYQAALAVGRALEACGSVPAAMNIWTRGAHARRTRLVYAKVFGSQSRIGVIAWTPEGSRNQPWWRSSERSREFLDETVGYLFERVLSSGRWAGPEPRNHEIRETRERGR